MTWQAARAAALVANQPFFELIYRDLRGMVAVVTRDEHGKLNSERWFPIEQVESARQYAAARHDEDVYFSVSSFPPNPVNKSLSTRTSTSESLTNIVYADADTCDPSNFRLEPSVIVTTSPGRWHCLWVLDKPMSGQMVGDLSAKVSTAHAAQGCDKHAKDTKILRVPGTTNTKYGHPHIVTAEYTGKVYSFNEFAAAYEDIVLQKTQVGNASEELNMSVYTPEQLGTIETYARTCWDNAIAELNAEADLGYSGQGWDNVAYRVSCKMARIAKAPWTEWTLDDVARAMDNSRLNDGGFQASGKLDGAVRAIGEEYLALPDWALEYQNITLPNIEGADYLALEERVERAGLGQWYNSVPQQGDANAVVLDFAERCREHGFTNEEAFAIVTHSNTFQNIATVAPQQLWLNLTGSVDIEIEIPDIPLTRGDWREVPPFLSPKEREWCIANPAFPDEHVEWVKSTGTDAASVYQRTLAFTILSAVYGDLAFLRESHGESRLNFYTVIAGDSTMTRKTTALNRALTVIREFEERTGRVVELTSNATSEALNKALSEDDGNVKLMWTDEFQGYLDEVGQKRYLAGFLGTLAKLFDGKVEAALRIGKESGNARADVTFDFVGVGIRKHIANALTKKNYESGFIPRFVWAVADPPPFTPNVMDVEAVAAKRDDDYGKYASLTQVVNHMVRSRRKIGEDKYQPVFITDEAIARYNKMGHVAAKYLIETEQMEYVQTALLRFGTSVRKAAALLALHDGSLEVRLDHMLHAIRQAEFWFRDMIRMGNEISSSDYERIQDEMEKYIVDAPKNKRPYSDVRNRFRGLKTLEFQEYIANLQSRGRVKYDSKVGVITAFVV